MRAGAGAGKFAAGLTALLALLFLSGAALADVPPPLAVTPGPITVSGSHWTCSYDNPEYMVHAGGDTATVFPGTQKFAVTVNDNPGAWTDPYESAGYDSSLSSQLCNGRHLIGHPGVYGKSYVLPVRLGRQGRITVSAHYRTSGDFRGDTGPRCLVRAFTARHDLQPDGRPGRRVGRSDDLAEPSGAVRAVR